MYRKHNKFARWQPRFQTAEPYDRFIENTWWGRWKIKPKTRKLKFIRDHHTVVIRNYPPKWHMFWHRQENIRAGV